MSSVLRGFSQISRTAGVLVSLTSSTKLFLDYTQGTATAYEGLRSLTSANGVLRIDGSTIVFDTAKNAVTALTAGVANYFTYTSANETADTTLFREMGKNIYIFVQNNTGGVPELFCVLTRVQAMQGFGAEGDGVLPIAAGSGGAGAGLVTGYLATWSANPAGSVGNSIPVGVARTGFGHAF